MAEALDELSNGTFSIATRLGESRREPYQKVRFGADCHELSHLDAHGVGYHNGPLDYFS